MLNYAHGSGRNSRLGAWRCDPKVVRVGAVAVRYGVQHFGNNLGDNSPRIIWAIALVANFIGFWSVPPLVD